jgi:hypothetical protein
MDVFLRHIVADRNMCIKMFFVALLFRFLCCVEHVRGNRNLYAIVSLTRRYIENE